MVHLVSEVVERSQRILVLQQKHTYVSDALKRKFSDAGTELFVSAQPPPRLDQFDYIFAVNSDDAESLIESSTKTLIVIIYAGFRAPSAVRAAMKRSVRKESRKLIELSADYISESDFDRILWFAFSKSKEEILSLTTVAPRADPVSNHLNPFSFFHGFASAVKPKRLIIFILTILILFSVLPVPFIITSAVLSRNSLTYLQQGRTDEAQKTIAQSQWTAGTAYFFYRPVRQLYLLFSLAGFPDSVIAFTSYAYTFFGMYQSAGSDLNHFVRLLFIPEPSQTEIQDKELMIGKLTRTVNEMTGTTLQLREKLSSSVIKSPGLLGFLNRISLTGEKSSKILPVLKEALGNGAEQQYLLLIANDNQLRAGGGVIEAYGWVKVKNNSISDIRIQDADTGTFIPSETTEVPGIFSRYSGEKYLTFADAAYSAHFPDNYVRMRLMLEDTPADENFSGAFLITRTGISRLIRSNGELFLPGLKEKITGENVAIKAEIYKGDERFYQELFDRLRGSLRNTRAAPSLLSTLIQLLDEKHLLVLFNNQNTQAPFDSLYWSGGIITPHCILDEKNCTVDSLYTLESNLGNNNINPYIVKHTSHKASVRSDGSIAASVEVRLRNTASSFIPPSSEYKAYLQFLLPRDITVTGITKNNVRVDDADTVSSQLTIVGMALELKPKEQSLIRINYKFRNKLSLSKGTYQVAVQKQAGSPNSDFSFELALPHNLEATRYNFAPVVNGSKLNYNTLLDADKVFLIEFNKR